MTQAEFELLLETHRGDDTKDIKQEVLDAVCKNGWLKDGAITQAGYKALEPYKVDNAIIMAAGRSRRCMPLSNYLPKGLFEIKGQTLVERQIKQLHAAGVQKIILVAGYLKELYHEMAHKYKDLIVIDNDEWEDKNNLFSLWCAKDYLANSYICCSDNYFAHNVFREYVYDSYYACKYTDDFCDEYCVKGFDKSGYMTKIKKGGEKAWYTIGEAFFSKDFSRKFVELLQGELYDPELKYMLWDDFQIRHIAELKMKIKKYSDSECKEFDTNEDILEFYPGFKNFIEQYFQEDQLQESQERTSYLSNYADTKQYSVVATEQETGRLHVNENLFGPSPKCMQVLKDIKPNDLSLYDLYREDALALAISKKVDLPLDNILIHSGSSDVIKTIMTIVLNKGDTVLISSPSWNYYKSVVELRLSKAIYYNVSPGKDAYEFDTQGLLKEAKKYTPRIIIITSPHNPTGAIMQPTDVERVIKENPKSLVILDEAYLGFSDVSYDIKHLLQNYSNVVSSRTFSKLYALAGVRVGYALCTPMARQVFKLDVNPFRICNISRKLCIAALEDATYYEALKQKIMQIRDDFCTQLNKIKGIKAYKTYANFIYVRFDDFWNVQKLKDTLQKQGILVRLWTETSRLSMRITVAPSQEMQKVLQVIQDFAK